MSDFGSDVAVAAFYNNNARETSDAVSAADVADWRRGKRLPPDIEPLLELSPWISPESLQALRDAYRLAQAQDLARGAGAIRRRTGRIFSIVEGRATLAAAPRRSDLGAARDPGHQGLQQAVRREAQALARRLEGVDDDGTAAEVAGLAESLAALAALEPAALVKRLYDLFVLVTRIGGYNKGDGLKRAATGRNVPPLPAEGAGGLSALAGLAYAWALGFPTVEKLDARAARGQEFEATAEDAAALFAAARAEDVIPAVDAETLRVMTEAADPSTVPGKKAEAAATRHGADLTATAFQGVARYAAGDAQAEPFARRALAALQQAPEAAERFGGSELARAAVQVGVTALAAQAPAPKPPEAPPLVFLSYARADNAGRTRWKDWMLKFLSPLVRAKVIALFADCDIIGGEAWQETLRAQLAECDIFLVLASPHIFGSDYIQDVEIPVILDRIEFGEKVRFYPVLLTPTPQAVLSDLTARFQFRPGADKPLSLLPSFERERAMAEIADEVARLAQEIAKGPRIPENVEGLATKLVRRRQAPPAHWRPYIQELDFEKSDLSDATPLAGLGALAKLNLTGTKVADISPLASLTALTTLQLNATQVADITPLASLTGLEELSLSGSDISDIAPLSELTFLSRLTLGGKNVADITPLAGLTALTNLVLLDTRVRDVTPLAGLSGLKILSLWGGDISDITPLSKLRLLRDLGLWRTKVADITPLASLTALTSLDLSYTQVRDISPLAGLRNLTELYLADTDLSDISSLVGLNSLKRLSLNNTRIVDASPLAELKALQFLDLQGTGIAEVPPLACLTGLQSLSLSDTRVADVSPLAGLKELKSLSLENTAVTDISPLAGLNNLEHLFLKNTPVSDLAPIAHLMKKRLTVKGKGLTAHLRRTPRDPQP